jgi:hypothetical protein
MSQIHPFPPRAFSALQLRAYMIAFNFRQEGESTQFQRVELIGIIVPALWIIPFESLGRAVYRFYMLIGFC